jgi:hypothetical protein
MLASQLGTARSQRPGYTWCSPSSKDNGPAAEGAAARAGDGFLVGGGPAGADAAGTAAATSGGGPGGREPAAACAVAAFVEAIWFGGKIGGVGDDLAAHAPLDSADRAAGGFPAGVVASCPFSGVVGGIVAINLSGRGGDACPIGHCGAVARETANRSPRPILTQSPPTLSISGANWDASWLAQRCE